MTAPGASRIALMTTCKPFPERGGPISRMLSSTVVHTCPPLPVPRRYPTSAGAAFPVSDGRRVAAFFTRAFAEATRATSAAVAVPANRCGSVFEWAWWIARHTKKPAVPRIPKNTVTMTQ